MIPLVSLLKESYLMKISSEPNTISFTEEKRWLKASKLNANEIKHAILQTENYQRNNCVRLCADIRNIKPWVNWKHFRESSA